MGLSLQNRLDAEADERLKPVIARYNSGKRVKVTEFLSKNVSSLIGRSNVFVGGASAPEIMTRIPFYETVFVAVCHKCNAVADLRSLSPLLHSRTVVPVLLNSYSEYPEAFVKEVVKFPHFGRKEFSFYRDTTIVGASSQKMCQHCAKEKLNAILADPAADSETVKNLVRRFFSLLNPFVYPDFTLLDQFAIAVQQRDLAQVRQLMALGWTIQSIRTAQAFGSAQAVPLDRLLTLSTGGSVEPTLQNVSLAELKALAAEELGLTVPLSVPVEQYLEVVLPFQKRLSGLIDEIVEEGGSRPYGKVVETVQTINDELRKAETSKRFLAYRAIAGFAAGNSGLIGGLLLGGALGLGGYFAACGASVVGTIGAKALKKWKPVRDNRALHQFGRSMRASLQPAVAKVLSGYLGISTRAVEVWQLRKEVVEEPFKIALGGAASAKKGRSRSKTTKRKRKDGTVRIVGEKVTHGR